MTYFKQMTHTQSEHIARGGVDYYTIKLSNYALDQIDCNLSCDVDAIVQYKTKFLVGTQVQKQSS